MPRTERNNARKKNEKILFVRYTLRLGVNTIKKDFCERYVCVPVSQEMEEGALPCFSEFCL